MIYIDIKYTTVEKVFSNYSLRAPPLRKAPVCVGRWAFNHGLTTVAHGLEHTFSQCLVLFEVDKDVPNQSMFIFIFWGGGKQKIEKGSPQYSAHFPRTARPSHALALGCLARQMRLQLPWGSTSTSHRDWEMNVQVNDKPSGERLVHLVLMQKLNIMFDHF